ncbi:MAG: sensor histidine kinase [Anaerolineales bacterium]|nr:sensor histidine kinase [Anaerolineales bacterium]
MLTFSTKSYHSLHRFIWLILVTGSLLWFAANVPAFYQQVASAAPTAPRWYAAVTAGLDVVFVLVCSTVAFLIFRHQPDNRMAWLTSLVLIVWGGYNGLLIQTKGAIWGDRYGTLLYYTTESITLLGYMGWMLFFYLFPSGRFAPRWTKITAVGWVLFSGSWYLWPTSPYTPDNWPDWLFIPIVLSLWGSFLVAQVVRYRQISTPTERQQTKWVLYGIAVAVLIAPPVWVSLGTVFEVPLDDWPRHLLVQTAGIFGIVAIPLTIGIAVLRQRLFDIDLIINRTLVYIGLTGITVGIYALLVGGVGSLLQPQGNTAVAFVATGMVAVLFQPLRLRLQTAVDRLMYGQRDDPVGMLTQLAQRLETVDRPESILPTLVETIATALKLPHVSLWLPQDEEQWEPAAVYGSQTDELQMLLLLYQKQEIGRLFVAPRGRGERFSREDERLLTTIAQLSATTVQAVQLSLELQQSRRQLVTSREEERRRLRRDLHDGLGPVLASVALQADTARDLADSDPAETKMILNSIMEQAQTAVSDVRRLVYNLRPPALDELGLVGALRQFASPLQHQVAIRFETTALPEMPAAVEVAAYRIVQEALNNVIKHAHATTCIVAIEMKEVLQLIVQDDGIGISDSTVSGVGLISIKERAAELGGTCTIYTLANGGTCVKVNLPLPEERRL